jgi:GTPase
MAVPQVAIVGRPNVGKSSIFNWLAGRRLAIVDDMAGVTRDRLSQLIESGGVYFELFDTGGIGMEDVDHLTRQVEASIEAAIEAADLLLLVVDTRSGITPLDELVVERLRHVGKPILCLANKTDDSKFDSQADEFHRLGLGTLVKVSAHQGRNKDLLLDLILQRLPEGSAYDAGDEPELKIAMVGRRNVGKSTLINTLLESERMIVSEVPGTTRDSVDVRFELDGKPFLAIDTPGLRRTRSVRTDLDFYGSLRAQRSIRRADVVLMLLDAQQRVSKVDKQLCQYIAEQHKPCIFVVNKWDLLVDQAPRRRWVEYLHETFGSLPHVPIAFITARTGKNVKGLLDHTRKLFKQSRIRVSTGILNRVLRRALEAHPPPLHKNRRPKVYYATQVAVQPPTIVLKCNAPAAFAANYRRYLLSVFRAELGFTEIPIKLYWDRRGADEDRDDVKS